jgi:GH35 family endo-1,4-beta-xylanase
MASKAPTIEEVQEYCQERMNGIDPVQFWAFYTANGWVQGRARKPIKNWKACVITWEKTNKPASGNLMARLTDRSWADDIINQQGRLT